MKKLLLTDSNTFNTLKKEMGVSKRDLILLLEAFRRKNFLDAEDKFLGLGTPSFYKSDYFKASFVEFPKVNNWYQLTFKGMKALQHIEKRISVPAHHTERHYLNTIIFNQNYLSA